MFLLRLPGSPTTRPPERVIPSACSAVRPTGNTFLRGTNRPHPDRGLGAMGTCTDTVSVENRSPGGPPLRSCRLQDVGPGVGELPEHHPPAQGQRGVVAQGHVGELARPPLQVPHSRDPPHDPLHRPREPSSHPVAGHRPHEGGTRGRG